MKQKIELRYVSAPLISIIAFLLLIGGASYAYYSQSVGGIGNPSNISNANLTVPRGCTFLASATNCVITSSDGTTTNFTDSIISRAEMSQSYAGNNVAQSTCALNIGVQGQAGCRCTAFIDMHGSSTTNFITSSLQAQLTSSNTSHSQSLRSINTITNYTTTLKVSTTGTAVYENTALTLKAYNINSSQDAIAGVNFVYSLKADPICTVGDEAYTVTLNPNGGSVSPTTKNVIYGDQYSSIPTPTKSNSTFKGWNGRNLYNPDTMTLSNSSHTEGSDELYLYGAVYDRILGMGKWTPKTNTTYTIVLKIIENSYDKPISLMTDSRFYLNTVTNGTISAGKTGYHIITVTTRSDFSSVTLGSLWFQSSNTITGRLRMKMAIYEGTDYTLFEPYYIKSDTIVTQQKNHTLTAIWG